MFDIPKPATALHRFADHHQEAIQNAALMLGGNQWLQRAQNLLADLHTGCSVSRRVNCEATALLQLLTLGTEQGSVCPGSESWRTCDPVAAHEHEIDMLRIAFAEALLKANSQDCAVPDLSNGVREDD